MTDCMARILVVDDEIAVLGLFETLLLELGHISIPATNGKEALEILKVEVLDVILSDVMMPGMDGTVLLEHFRAISTVQHIKFVLMSDVRIRPLAVQPDKYIRKPYSITELESVLSELL